MNDYPNETAWFDRYQDLTLDAAVDLATAEGRPVRVITPDRAIITLEWQANRLNVWLDEAGDLLRMNPG